MKRAPAGAKVLQRVLNARQFCLKLIANVTYGYAAAGFSGRMPMAELADAIVQVSPSWFGGIGVLICQREEHCAPTYAVKTSAVHSRTIHLRHSTA